jgi:hypothetical protein
MSNIYELQAVVTSVDIGTPVAMDDTPLLGGWGREAKYHIPVLPLTSTVLIQGAPKIDPDTGIAPVEGSSLWETLLTLTSASDQDGQIDDLPYWIRWNTTVLDADGPDVKLILEGVQ